MLSQGGSGAAFTQSSQGIARAGLFVDVRRVFILLSIVFSHMRRLNSHLVCQEGASSQYTQESFSQFGGR